MIFGQEKNWFWLNVLAIAANIPVRFMTGFVLQGHKYENYHLLTLTIW